MQRIAAFALALFVACASAPPPPPPVVDEKTRGAIKALEDALAKNPANQPYTYLLASYYDKAHDATNVVKWLTRLDELGWNQGVPPYDFPNTKTRAFRSIAAKLDAKQPRVNRATTAFTLANQRDLVPEGIAYDPVDDVFYLSGIYRRNVLRVTRDGTATEFITQAQDGMYSGLGVKVDAQRRLLWVISTTAKEMRGYEAGNDRSMLAAYSLPEGRLVKKIDATPAMLNDLTLLRDGSLFATDMGRHKVVRLAPGGDALEIWAEDFQFPNGITVSDDERSLYVADFRGVTRFTIADKARQLIASKTLLNGIDGLSFDRGSLIGIQNAIGRARVVRIHPEDGRVEILEANNPLFELPTTGAVVGTDYWFIANPGLRFFNVADPVMLRLRL
jgi:sugar lactone lactonase YvrE